MTYFIAWIVVGICCYLIGKNRRDKYLPKYHLGMLFLQKNAEELKIEINPENVVLWSKIVERTMIFVAMLISPIALFFSVKNLFKKGPSEGVLRMKACCDEFSKRHGIVF
jgi:hypothetical protein